MRNKLSTAVLFAALFCLVAVDYDSGESYCVIFPEVGHDIFGVAQRNILIFKEDEVSLIPQVHFEGDARDFGIVVPVPAEPTLTTVGQDIFSEASFMTQPLVRNSNRGCSCDDDDRFNRGLLSLDVASDGALVDESSGGVDIIYEDIVGMFAAVVLRADSGDDLSAWLVANNYRFNPEDSDILQSYVDRDWFFVAMKFDTTQVPAFVDRWWNATTRPARITFAHQGSELIYPLKISALSTDERTEVLVYTIAADAMRFPGADVEYANLIERDELVEISRRYPSLATFISEGSFVTKLRRTFNKAEMKEDVKIAATDDRREFRQIRYINAGSMGWLGLALLALWALLQRRRGRQAS